MDLAQVRGLRRYFRENWLPEAIAMGLLESQFWGMTLEQYATFQEGKAKYYMKVDRFLWLMGRYVAEAVMSSMADRRHPHKYPEKPFMEQADDMVILDGSELSEEEKEAERMKFMRTLGFSPDMVSGMGDGQTGDGR